MVATMSTMLSLGTEAPDFSLPDTRGKMVSLSEFEKAPALLVIFMCNHCPYVKHVADALTVITREYQERGVAVVGINANDAEIQPDDSPEKMAEECEAARLQLPVLVRSDAGDGEGLSARPARRTSTSSTRSGGWSIAASSIRAGRGATFPSPATTSARP